MHKRYTITQPMDQACLVVMDRHARGAICDYHETRDQLDWLTGKELAQLGNLVWTQATWDKTPMMRDMTVGSIRFHFMWGHHYKVVAAIAELLAGKGLGHVPFETPLVPDNSINLYLVGAERR